MRAALSQPYVRPPLALTLIELLAVIVILSLVAGTAIVSLAAAGDSARLHSAVAQWRDLDSRARMLGRSVGPTAMTVDKERNEVSLRAISSNELLAMLALPQDVTGEIGGSSPVDAIEFDRFGRSADYYVELRSSDRAVQWQVCGLTGYVVEGRP